MLNEFIWFVSGMGFMAIIVYVAVLVILYGAFRLGGH